MFESLIHPVIDFLLSNPVYGGLITFGFAFVESLAIVGSIIPGSVTMTAIGSMVGMSVLPLFGTLAWAVAGALIGDYLSYIVGFRYKHSILNWPWIRRYSSWVNKSEAFVQKHGVMSIIIGRFFGPMRSMIPLVAGVLNMSLKTFTIAVIPSAILWSIVYLTPGIFIGAISADFPDFIPLNLIGATLVALVFLTLFLSYVRKFLRTSSFVNRVAFKINNCPHKLRHLILAIIYLLCFLGLVYGMDKFAYLETINNTFYILMQSFWNKGLNYLALSTTFLADKKVLFGVSIFGGILLLKSNKKGAITWIVYIVFAALVIKFFKIIIHHPRPPIIANVLGSTSFPSGHVSYITALLGFWLCVLEDKKLSSALAKIFFYSIVSWVFFSRIYIGAHWLFDVVAGIFTGLFIAHAAMIFVNVKYFNFAFLKKIRLYIVIVWLALLFGYNYLHLYDYYVNYFPPQHVNKLSFTSEQLLQDKIIPLVRKNRFGTSVDALNLRVVTAKQPLLKLLKSNQWNCSQFIDKSYLKAWLADMHKKHCSIPLIPPTLDNKNPSIIAIKNFSNKSHVLILWPTRFMNKNQNLWLGSLYEEKNNNPMVKVAVKRFIIPNSFNKYKVIKIKYSGKLSWDGRIAIVDLKRSK